MGKGLRLIGKRAPTKTRAPPAKKALTSANLAAAIANKQYNDTIKNIEEYLKSKPHAAPKILHLFETGVFDEDHAKSDMIPQSTNKFRLLSFPVLKAVVDSIASGCSKEMRDQVQNLKLKSEALKVIQFAAGVCDTCAIPSRNMDRLCTLLEERAAKLPDRLKRLRLMPNGKDGKKGGAAFDDTTGVFEFSGWDEAHQKWTHLQHRNTKTTIPVPDDMVLGKKHTIIDNFSEFSAKIKGRRVEAILDFWTCSAKPKTRRPRPSSTSPCV